MNPSKPCPEYIDELALVAGSDLPVDEERIVLAHAEACAGCQQLLVQLMGNQALFARAAQLAEPVESLLPAVMARVATEAHVQQVQAAQREILASSAGVRGRMPPAALVPFLRIAAAVVLVVASGLFGMAVLDHERQGGELADGSLSADDGPQVAVRRLPGEAIEVSWAGDGREGAEAGAGKPYKVLASANPRDFAGAKEVEVAGRRLVTDLPLPAARAQDRRITYFRVQ